MHVFGDRGAPIFLSAKQPKARREPYGSARLAARSRTTTPAASSRRAIPRKRLALGDGNGQEEARRQPRCRCVPKQRVKRRGERVARLPRLAADDQLRHRYEDLRAWATCACDVGPHFHRRGVGKIGGYARVRDLYQRARWLTHWGFPNRVRDDSRWHGGPGHAVSGEIATGLFG
jgi:hypothetical protein